MRRLVSRPLGVIALTGVLALAAAAVFAQEGGTSRIWRGGYGFTAPPRFANANTFVGGFNFCRLAFTSNRREKRGWSTDYPGADINLSVRLGELTKARVTKDHQGEPEYIVVRATDDDLFKCPFLVGEDVGTVVFSPAETLRLREYFEKGGFLFVSDYWGVQARDQFDEQIARVLPPKDYPIVDVPMDHPVFHSLFDVKQVPQLASIQTWRRTGGTAEFRSDSDVADVRGIMDAKGRLMVLMAHDTDLPDAWEREGEEPEYFYRFSPDSYSVAIDIILYSMTH
jgi:hypothetical protein